MEAGAGPFRPRFPPAGRNRRIGPPETGRCSHGGALSYASGVSDTQAPDPGRPRPVPPPPRPEHPERDDPERDDPEEPEQDKPPQWPPWRNANAPGLLCAN